MTDVIFGGRCYRRYNEYYRCTADGSRYLHRDIWELHNGPVPDGYHVHHKDEDQGNNSIENLQALPEETHRRLHGITSEWHRSEAARAHLDSIRDASHEWHKKQENREAQSANTKAWFDAQPWLEKTCAHCGAPFKAKRPVARFCSRNCGKYAYAKAHK